MLRRHKVLTHGQERLFRKVTSVSIHSFVEWLYTFFHVLRPADVTVKEVSHIRCFAIDIAKDFILLSCRLAMEHLCRRSTHLMTLADPKFISLTTIQVGKRIKVQDYDVYVTITDGHVTIFQIRLQTLMKLVCQAKICM